MSADERCTRCGAPAERGVYARATCNHCALELGRLEADNNNRARAGLPALPDPHHSYAGGCRCEDCSADELARLEGIA